MQRGVCCVRNGSDANTHAITPNNVGPTLLRVVASVLAVVCIPMQQLPTILAQQCWKLLRSCWQWCAYGCTNSQQCWPNNAGNCCVSVSSGVRTVATTPNYVGPTLLGVVALVLAVVCIRLQQLPKMLRPVVHHGMDTTHKTLETMYNERAWPQQSWKSSSNESNIVALRVGDHGTEEMLGFVSSKV